MPEFPYPGFPFIVEWAPGRFVAGFTEVSGISPNPSSLAMAGPRLSSMMRTTGVDSIARITLKRGVILADRDFQVWMTAGSPRTMRIIRLNEQRQAVQSWTVVNARPMKMQGPSLAAAGNDVAIESLELSLEGIELHQ